MRQTMRQTMRQWLAATAVLLLAACTSSSGDPAAPLPGSGSIGDGEYPDEPYSTTNVGAVMENLTFPGYARPADGIGASAQVAIALADFYNPTGDGVFDVGSPFGEGEPKPRALIINIAGLWCAPCKFEAAEVLPQEYAALQPRGLELIGLLADTATPGEPATFKELDAWVTAFDSPYPSVIDPPYRLAAPFGQSFPVNYIIDPTTMTIVDVVKGLPQESFWSQVDQLLAE
jgi:hypothetical protein